MRGRRKGFCVDPRRTRDARPRARRSYRAPAALLAAAASIPLIAGCGGQSRANAGEPTTTYRVAVVHASFPRAQSIARQTKFELAVRNTGHSTVPNLAITVHSFNYVSQYVGLADKQRPVWIVERGPGRTASPPVNTEEVSVPGSDQTAYVDTWALGALQPGRTRNFTWRVVPVKSGLYTVHYIVSAGLGGNAKARTASGDPVHGQFAVYVAPAPPLTHVNPSTGKVEVGQFPSSP